MSLLAKGLAHQVIFSGQNSAFASKLTPTGAMFAARQRGVRRRVISYGIAAWRALRVECPDLSRWPRLVPLPGFCRSAACPRMDFSSARDVAYQLACSRASALLQCRVPGSHQLAVSSQQSAFNGQRSAASTRHSAVAVTNVSGVAQTPVSPDNQCHAGPVRESERSSGALRLAPYRF